MNIYRFDLDEHDKEKIQKILSDNSFEAMRLRDIFLRSTPVGEDLADKPAPVDLAAPAKVMTPKNLGAAIAAAKEKLDAPPAEVCAICKKDPHAKWCGKPTPPPAEVPAPEPISATEVVDRFVEKQGEDDAKEMDRAILGEPEPKPPRSAGKECCGSKAAWRHKVNCPTLKKEPETAAPADEIDVAATESEEDEEVEPKDAPKQDEEQAFACRECGNARMEPYGTNPLALFCPNELGDDGDKHVYELKED